MANITSITRKTSRWLVGFAASMPLLAGAAVLPEDRVDIMYHGYDGGGATIDGPSVLVRKGVGDSVSVYANYYVDMVTSATIDVEVQGASEYEEERTEYTLGMDYLYNKAIVSVSYSNSSENDYEAETYSLGVSQDFFGDLTNLSLGFSYGSNLVSKNEEASQGQPGFEPFEPQDATSRRYKLGISQVLTPSLIMAVDFETVVDEGFLNNPYRQVRAVDTQSGGNSTIFETEVYPNTRNSDAFAVRAIYYLPYRATVRGEYRSFSDSWGIEADSYELRYIHPIESWGLTIEGKYRAYDQTQADFYNDLFPFPNFTGEEFRARDKEMSAFGTQTVGLGLTYEIEPGWPEFFDKTSLNFYWDHIQFDYDNFRDARSDEPFGTEPFYSFDADVFRVFVSFWY